MIFNLWFISFWFLFSMACILFAVPPIVYAIFKVRATKEAKIYTGLFTTLITIMLNFFINIGALWVLLANTACFFLLQFWWDIAAEDRIKVFGTFVLLTSAFELLFYFLFTAVKLGVY